MTFESYPQSLFALCIWREARSQGPDARRGVKHVLLNRTAHPSGPYQTCATLVANILQPFQFSSFNPSDANAVRLPNPKNTLDWQAWQEICALVDEETTDPTGGANYYFSVQISAPQWADPLKETVRLGAFRFYKL